MLTDGTRLVDLIKKEFLVPLETKILEGQLGGADPVAKAANYSAAVESRRAYYNLIKRIKEIAKILDDGEDDDLQPMPGES